MLSHAWGGFLSADLTCKINVLFRHLVRFGYLCIQYNKDSLLYCGNNLTVSDLLGIKADTDMFRNMCKSHHCLHHLLPTIRSSDNLRDRGHSYNLSEYNTSIHKKSFVVRTLYEFI